MKNLHLEHLEDLMFNESSVLTPLVFLKSAISWLSGYGGLFVSTKWDGAPAFVCGPHPQLGTFFVGTKSVFSGKVNFTEADIVRNHGASPELCEKLKDLRRYMRPLNIPNVVQGDLLWWPGSFKYEKPNIEFRPNTLTYKVPLDYLTGIGAVLHTTYRGQDLKDMEASMGVDFGTFDAKKSNIHNFNPQFNADNVNLFKGDSLSETNLIAIYDIVGKRALGVDYSVLRYFASPKINDLVKKYVNSEIRKNLRPCATMFIAFLIDHFHTHAEKLKTQKAKDRVMDEKFEWLEKFRIEPLQEIFWIYNHLDIIKRAIIKVIDRTNNISVTLPDGTPCGHEGYVIQSPKTREVCKFVDRQTFSRSNMTAEKEWKKK